MSIVCFLLFSIMIILSNDTHPSSFPGVRVFSDDPLYGYVQDEFCVGGASFLAGLGIHLQINCIIDVPAKFYHHNGQWNIVMFHDKNQLEFFFDIFFSRLFHTRREHTA